jgi:Domain of unknown function (DUF4136)
MRIASLIGTALTLMSTAAFAQEVSYDFDKSADFSTVQTYSWVRGTPVNDEFNHRRIVEAIDAQLAAKGLRRVQGSDNADVAVAYHAVFAHNLEIHALSSGWGGYRFGPSRSGTARVEDVLIGTLVVDLISTETGSTLWRGTASREIDVKASPEKREKNIGRATEKLFKHYPPEA